MKQFNQCELIKEAERTFLEHYEARRQNNRDLKLPKQIGFPIVTRVKINFLHEEDDTLGIETIVYCQSKKKNKYEIKVVCYSDEVDACCFGYTGAPSHIIKFAQEFAAHLFFNILSERGIVPKDWENIA